MGEEKVGGCGGLALIPGDIEINYRGLCQNMIALSDNTATNKLINIFSIDYFNREFNQFGLEKTRIRRLLFDAVGKEKGLENTFALDELLELLKGLYRGEIISEKASQAILETLKMQQINHKIPDRIPTDVTIAHKTGEDEGITHDIGIVYGPEPFILGFASNQTDVMQTEQIIRSVSGAIYRALQTE